MAWVGFSATGWPKQPTSSCLKFNGCGMEALHRVG